MTTEPEKKRKPKEDKLPKLLQKMIANPRDDWTIENIKTAANKIGVEWRPPNGGSHYTFFSPYLLGNVCVPYKRPIKAPYVRMFTEMCRAHIDCQAGEGDKND